MGNILGIWLFQVPVNLLAILAAHKLSGPWLMVLLLVAACTARPQPAATAPPESMVVVPSGWFLMGQDEGPRSNRPQRSVYLDAFALDRTEVTNAAFAEFIEETGYQAAGWDEKLLEAHANEPVVGVLWREAEAYCDWTDKRLPTEAEWEKAARGPDGRRYPWGNTWEAAYANTAENNQAGVLPVASFPAGASPYGALDMAGNAVEWVNDYFDFSYYTYAPDHNPPGPSAVMDHGLRGGSWASPHQQAQTFFRDSSHSVQPNPRVGFRCAMTLPEEANRVIEGMIWFQIISSYGHAAMPLLSFNDRLAIYTQRRVWHSFQPGWVYRLAAALTDTIPPLSRLLQRLIQ